MKRNSGKKTDRDSYTCTNSAQERFSLGYDKNEWIKNIVKYGQFYYPASKHYIQRDRVDVQCDKCYRKKLSACIGYSNKDLCLNCAEIVSNSLDASDPFAPIPDFIPRPIIDPILPCPCPREPYFYNSPPRSFTDPAKPRQLFDPLSEDDSPHYSSHNID